VVALADVPAAVGIRCRRAGTLGRSPAVERHDRGVEADRAVVARKLLLAADADRGLQQHGDHSFEALPVLMYFCRRELFALFHGGVFVHDPVFHLDGGIHDREGEVEQVAHLAVAGEKALSRPRISVNTERMTPVRRQVAEQQLRGCLQVQEPLVEGQQQQCHQQCPQREAARSPGLTHEEGLEVPGHLGGVDDLGGEGDLLLGEHRGDRRYPASFVHWL
jgi:hypothetical protein